ncbi:MAG TPA: hypothetical protein VHG88_12130 [Burkholderiales bacterium]|nr:hypothetical protein [Burkholderiales bacterium]
MELIYARWLGWCSRVALAVLTGSFLLYVFGAEPLVPLEQLPALWRLPVGEYVAATGAPTGWGWVYRLGFGDYANMLGVALLCLVTAVCYLRVLPNFFGNGERALGVLALLQVIVLVAAASGLFAAGH